MKQSESFIHQQYKCMVLDEIALSTTLRQTELLSCAMHDTAMPRLSCDSVHIGIGVWCLALAKEDIVMVYYY